MRGLLNYTDKSWRLLLYDIEELCGSGTVRDIFLSQLFQPFLADNHLKYIRRAIDVGEIWSSIKEKVKMSLCNNELRQKVYKAVRYRYDEGDNHPHVKKVKGMLETHQNITSREDEGDYPQPRKAIEREPSQAKVATLSEKDSPNAVKSVPGGSQKKMESPKAAVPPHYNFDTGRDPMFCPPDCKPFLNQWPPSP